MSRITLSSIFLSLLMPIFASAQTEITYYKAQGVRSNDTLKIRAEPTTQSAKVGDIPPNASCIQVTDCEGEGKNRWCAVEYEGQAGWSAARYLVPAPCDNAPVTTTSTAKPVAVNPPPSPSTESQEKTTSNYHSVYGVVAGDVLTLRQTGSSKAKSLGEIPADGDCIHLLRCEGKDKKARWCLVEYRDKKGWVAGKYLKSDTCPRGAYTPPAAPPLAKAVEYRNYARKIDQSLKLFQKITKKQENVTLTLWVDKKGNPQRIDEPVEQKSKVSYYFRDGKLYYVIAPKAIFGFAKENLLFWTDDNLISVEASAWEKQQHQQTLLQQARDALAVFAPPESATAEVAPLGNTADNFNFQQVAQVLLHSRLIDRHLPQWQQQVFPYQTGDVLLWTMGTQVQKIVEPLLDSAGQANGEVHYYFENGHLRYVESPQAVFGFKGEEMIFWLDVNLTPIVKDETEWRVQAHELLEQSEVLLEGFISNLPLPTSD